MKIGISLIAALALVLVVPSSAAAKNKKKQPQRGMLESMQSVPCGVNERGLSGLGSIFGSVGVQHVNSHEKLCPQYLLRTDEMEYHIRPLDTKHAVLLPIGHEGEFKIKKDKMILKVPDEDKKKTRDYQVVSMQPVISGKADETSAYRPTQRPAESRHTENSEDKDKTERQVENRPPR
jgi:hypothetical protein